MKTRSMILFGIAGLLGTTELLAQGFESSATLPAGVRNVSVRQVNSDLNWKTNEAGQREALAKPLHQDLTFGKIAQGEAALKADKMRAFLTANDFSEDDVVGSYTADLSGRIEVTAPIMAYGFSENLTVGVAIPYYRAVTAVEVGFTPNETAQRFLNTLASPVHNEPAAASEAGYKLNHAVDGLNAKLEAYDYDRLEDWRAEGVGDVTALAKYRFYSSPRLGMAVANGLVLPTGRVDDPDILTDIPFGDGQTDIFSQFIIDEKVGLGVRFNQYLKYTHQLPAQKEVRAVTAEDAVVPDSVDTAFKLGDKVDAGVAAMFEPTFGMVAGVGYAFFHKYGDVYRNVLPETKAELEKGTDQQGVTALYQIGYSSVSSYLAGKVAVPFELKLSWTEQVASRNMPVTDLAQVDVNLFF